MSRQTALLGIMEASDFKARTKATTAVGGFMSKFQSRGGGMSGIDLALEDWSRDCDKASVATAQKLARVSAIAVECDKWFKQKAELGKSTDLSEARSQVIGEVRRACIKAHQYLKNKVVTEARTPAHSSTAKRGATKGLEQGYSHERTDYLASGKQANPYAASAVAESGAHVDAMSYSQFTTAASGLENNRVEYMNREQRLANLVTIQNGRLYQDGEELNHYDPSGGIATLWPNTYAMDKYGNIYSKKAKWKGVYFNHSSYCAGKAVICAGTLGCHEGRLVYVSNMSGHYKPNAAYLGQLLRILAEEGVDLSETLVEAMDTKKGMKALTMLGSPSAAEDWPHWVTRGTGKLPRLMIRGQETEIRNPA